MGRRAFCLFWRLNVTIGLKQVFHFPGELCGTGVEGVYKDDAYNGCRGKACFRRSTERAGMIAVRCSNCGLEIMVPPSVQGREGTCLNCGNPVKVPSDGVFVPTSIMQFNPGEKIAGRYSILSFIGRGGMGVVYHAEDTLVKEEVALKFLRTDILRTEKWRYMFLQEAQIARRLRHENIVAVHDVTYTSDGILFLSMEYAKGRSLRELLRRHREEKVHILPRLTVSIGLQVLDALHYAHRLVVHRDIKPENIILMANEHVKVLDFGLAKVIEEEGAGNHSSASPLQRKRQVIGTEAYASPEQLLHAAVDLRADIYSLGLVLRELLTLRTPPEYPADLEIKRDDVAPGVLEVVAKAVNPDRNERWQSAKAFRDALKSAFDSAYHPVNLQENNHKASKNGSVEGMVYFQGGGFLMGNDAVREEAPEAEVHVEPFWMDIYPVTVAQYAHYLKETGAPEPRYWRDSQLNGPEQPVVGVAWDEASAYACWAGKQLPGEAQWEFAARGRANRKYPWGNLPPDTTRCNYRNYLGMPSIVTMHEDGRTPEGLFDMAGNVYEWTLDPFMPYDHARKRNGNPDSAPRKAVRGGCYESGVDELTTTARKGFFQNVRQRNVGFRCVINCNVSNPS